MPERESSNAKGGDHVAKGTGMRKEKKKPKKGAKTAPVKPAPPPKKK